MIRKELRDVFMSLMFTTNKQELMRALFQRFELLLLSEINVDDYQILIGHLNTIKSYIGSEE